MDGHLNGMVDGPHVVRDPGYGVCSRDGTSLNRKRHGSQKETRSNPQRG
jgi:hypothetical protein